jgi:hypothetical protein
MHQGAARPLIAVNETSEILKIRALRCFSPRAIPSFGTIRGATFMKIYLPIIGIALAALLLSLTGTVLAAPADSTGPLTTAHSWRIEHDNLSRVFSQGLGVDLACLRDAATP